MTSSNVLVVLAVTLFLTTTTATCFASTAPPATMKLFLGDDIFNDIEMFLDPFIPPLIDDLNVKNISVSKGEAQANITNIKITNFQMDELGFQSKPPHSWVFSVNDVAFDLTMNYSAAIDTTKIVGSGLINASKTNVAIGFDLTGNDGHFNMSVDVGTLDVGALNITFQGDDAKILDLLAKMLTGEIQKELAKVIMSDLAPKLDAFFQQFWSTLPIALPLYDYGELYFGFVPNTGSPDAPVTAYTAGYTQFAFALAMIPQSGPDTNPFPHHQLPNAASSTSGPSPPMFGLTLDDYFLNSVLFQVQSTGYLKWTRVLNKKITTATLKNFIPDLYAKYPNDYIYTNFSVDRIPSITFSKTSGGMDLFLPITVNMSVLSNGTMVENVVDLRVNVTGSLAVTVTATNDEVNLTAQVKTLGVSMALGEHLVDFNVSLLQPFFNAILQGSVVPLINGKLKPIPIPGLLAGLTIDWQDGYVGASFTLDLFADVTRTWWVPPTSSATPSLLLPRTMEDVYLWPLNVAKHLNTMVYDMLTMDF